MQHREYPDENLIVQQDILSGNSKIIQDLVSWSLAFGGGSMDSIIISYSRTPDEILQLLLNVENIVINNSGEIGVTVEKRLCKIGEYRMIASAEHCFNAVVCCFEGGDKYNLNNKHDAEVFNAAFSIGMGGVKRISSDGVMVIPFFASSNDGFITLSFDQHSIAQQVYDSDLWENCREKTTVSTTPPEWYETAQNQSSKKSGGCYVATAVYGSYDCPQVWTLRRYRDYDLAEHWYGRAFIRLYYAISPTIVKWFGKTKWFNQIWRKKLDQKVNYLQAKGYSSSPYNDRDW